MSKNLFHFPRTRVPSINVIVVSATVAVAAWSPSLGLAQSAQIAQRVIDKAFSRYSVVGFEEIGVSEKSVKFGEAFDGGMTCSQQSS